MLQKLSEEAARLIKSQQYIVDAYIITKELIENSLDADSTSIKVLLDEDSVTLEDNGKGISDIHLICKHGYTSKEDTTYEVLGIEGSEQGGFSHGFRGQALASIRELCDVEITTRTANDNLAKNVKFDKSSTVNYRSFSKSDDTEVKNLIEIKMKPRELGTTIKVTNLFKNCPIRRNLSKKNIRKTVERLSKLIESFCYVYNVHFSLIFKGNTIISELGSHDTIKYAIKKHVKDGEIEVINLLKNALNNKESLHYYKDSMPKNMDLNPDHNIHLLEDRKINLSCIEPLFYSKDYLLHNTDQYLFTLFPFDKSSIQTTLINKRVCKYDTITSMVNSLFKSHENTKPTFILIIKEKSDINISIDKSEAIVKDSKLIESKIKQDIIKFLSDRIHISGNMSEDSSNVKLVKNSFEGTMDVNKDSYLQNSDCMNNCTDLISFEGDLSFNVKKMKINLSNDKLISFDSNSNTEKNIIEANTITSSRKSSSANSLEKHDSIKDIQKLDSSIIINNDSDICYPNHGDLNTSFLSETAISRQSKSSSNVYDYIKEESLSHSSIVIEKSDFMKMKIIGQFNQGFILCVLERKDKKILLIVDQHASDEICNFERLNESFILKKQHLIHPIKLDLTPIQKLIVDEYNNETKNDSERLNINEFLNKEHNNVALENIENKILEDNYDCKDESILKTPSNTDNSLFYNLCENEEFDNSEVIRNRYSMSCIPDKEPLKDACNKICCGKLAVNERKQESNLIKADLDGRTQQNVFENNGFIIKDYKLYTVPVYYKSQFNKEDFYSLLDNISKGIYTSDKFRNIMASKACRSSIMIGQHLGQKEMYKILENLSTLKKPWNCPHGRPTFKVLMEF